MGHTVSINDSFAVADAAADLDQSAESTAAEFLSIEKFPPNDENKKISEDCEKRLGHETGLAYRRIANSNNEAISQVGKMFRQDGDAFLTDDLSCFRQTRGCADDDMSATTHQSRQETL